MTTRAEDGPVVERADVVGSLTGFARALRAAGVNADRSRLTTALAALDQVDLGRADDVYWATRLSLCSEPDDLPRFDALFDMWFRGVRPAMPAPTREVAPKQDLSPVAALGRNEQSEQGVDDDDVLRTAASEAEILRHRDLGELTGAEREEIHRLIALLAPRVGKRRTLRRTPRGGRPGRRAPHGTAVATRRRRARRTALHRPA